MERDGYNNVGAKYCEARFCLRLNKIGGGGGKRRVRGMTTTSVPNLVKLSALEARIFVSEYFIEEF